MKFNVDAQLPPRLATHLTSKGHHAVHVASLPRKVLTPDAEISAFADEAGRVVVTKDADFRHSHAVSGTPQRLLVVATGNISNDELLALFDDRLDEITAALEGHEQYPTVDLADIYAVLTYYLRHTRAVDAHLDARAQASATVRAANERTDPPPNVSWARLLERRG